MKAIEQIGQEQSAEEKHLLRQERPHAQLDRVVLLDCVVKVMRDDAAGVAMAVIRPMGDVGAGCDVLAGTSVNGHLDVFVIVSFGRSQPASRQS